VNIVDDERFKIGDKMRTDTGTATIHDVENSTTEDGKKEIVIEWSEDEE
jgi:hypothetical protein